MPSFLRKIRKTRWYKNPDFNLWLGENEIPADPLADLNTKDNNLSVWKVEDDKYNLDDIIIALATNGDYISDFSYALFDSNILSDINIEYVQSLGESKYHDANKYWHFDLVKLSGKKLIRLAEEIFKKGGKKRINEKKLKKLFSEKPDILVKLDQEKLKEKVKEAVRNALK